MPLEARDIVGVLLAGGQARRMGGGDKCLRPLGGRPILARIVDRVAPQVGELILSANGDLKRFAGFGLPVVADVISGHAGPLAGILSAMEWVMANRPGIAWIATFPTDAPFVPTDMVVHLARALTRDGADLACAASGGRPHPVIGLWSVALAADLRHAMEVEEIRKIDRWTARHRLVEVPWPQDPIDPFFNANRPEDLARAEAILQQTADTGAG